MEESNKSVDIRALGEKIARESAFVNLLTSEINNVIVGQNQMIERLMIGLLGGGHILLEGVPGLAKTLAINSLAKAVDGDFSRIQFTPDLLPADVIGTMIYTVQTLASGAWRVVGVSFVQEIITDNLREIARLLALAAIAIVAATLAVSFLFSRVLSRPIHDLISAMAQFEKNADNFVYEPVSGVREVQNLSASFAHMVRKIQQLMATVRAEEVNLRKTELRALQAQINPHFLYNTLDSISWMCERGKNQEAVVMVNALAQLFRISISKGHELIPIRSEVQHAKSYLQIQSVRYKDQFSYRFEVDESCLDYLCNKITLQPIIENAIYHGINGLVDEGEIVIRIESQGDDILATVEDNGVGMEKEQIDAIFRRSDSKSGIGIKNVNDRLKIWFGEAYGITIESVPDEGTRVIVRMPKKQKE